MDPEPAVGAAPQSRDTPLDVEEILLAGYRRMTPAEKAATVTALTSSTIALTMAGIRHRYPGETPETHRVRLAAILHGDLAERLFPAFDFPR